MFCCPGLAAEIMLASLSNNVEPAPDPGQNVSSAPRFWKTFFGFEANDRQSTNSIPLFRFGLILLPFTKFNFCAPHPAG
jgi:hypothetical protein